MSHQDKIRYKAEEALHMILDAAEDSDFGGLSDLDHEDIPESAAELATGEFDNGEDELDTEYQEDEALARFSNRSFRMPGSRSRSRANSTPRVTRQGQPGSSRDDTDSDMQADDLNVEVDSNIPPSNRRVTRQSQRASTSVDVDSDMAESETVSSETESCEYASDGSDLDPDDVTIEDTLRNHKCRWRNTKPPTPSTHFQGEPFSLPPDNFEEISPYDIFTQFWSDDITELLVEQTNLYSVLKNGTSVYTNFAEIEQFLGI